MAFLDETGVTQLTSDIKNLADAAYTKQNVVASAYNASSTYAVGDYCIYGGQLYRCTTAIATAEAWNSTHWTNTTVTDEFDRVGAVYVIEPSVNSVVYDPNVTTGSKLNPTSVTLRFYTITNGTKAELNTNFNWLLDSSVLDDDHDAYMGSGRGTSETINFSTCPDVDGTYTLTAQIKNASNVVLAKCFVPIVFAGAGVPSGGGAGQLLAKNSAADYDTTWINAPSSLPSGGTAGQVLTKNSATDGDAGWGTVRQLPSGGSTGQVLEKRSSTAGDAQWSTIYTLPTPNSTNYGQIAQVGGTTGNYRWTTVNYSPPSIYIVYFNQSGSTITCNKTISEIISAIEKGYTVIASLNSDYYTLYNYNSYAASFARLAQEMSADKEIVYYNIIEYNNTTIQKKRIGALLCGFLNPEYVIRLGYEGGDSYSDDPQQQLTNQLYIESVTYSGGGNVYASDYQLNFHKLQNAGSMPSCLTNITLQYGKIDPSSTSNEVETYRCTHFAWKEVQTTDPDYDESWMPDFIDGYGGLMRGELTFKVLSEHNSSEVIKTFKIKTYTYTWGPEIDEYYMYRTITYTETPLSGQSASGVSF